MKSLPGEIKNVYKISSVLIITVMFSGIVFKMPELYLAFPVGGIFSLINTLLMVREAYRIIYIKENSKGRTFFGYIIRMGIFASGMFLVIFITQKKFPEKTVMNIIFTGLGFIVFKISLFINQKVKKFAKKK